MELGSIRSIEYLAKPSHTLPVLFIWIFLASQLILFQQNWEKRGLLCLKCASECKYKKQRLTKFQDSWKKYVFLYFQPVRRSGESLPSVRRTMQLA